MNYFTEKNKTLNKDKLSGVLPKCIIDKHISILIPINEIQDKFFWKTPDVKLLVKTVIWTNNDQIRPRPKAKLLAIWKLNPNLKSNYRLETHWRESSHERKSQKHWRRYQWRLSFQCKTLGKIQIICLYNIRQLVKYSLLYLIFVLPLLVATFNSQVGSQ